LSFSVPMLALGLSITAIGIVMLILSFRPARRKGEAIRRGVGVVFIGPLPIVFGGSKKLVLIGMAAALAMALLLLIAYTNPSMVGW